jgi:hypothetical protein
MFAKDGAVIEHFMASKAIASFSTTPMHRIT